MAQPILATKPHLYRFAGKLGWKDFIKRLDLYRYLNYPLVLHNLQVRPGMKLLDVGSANSIFPVYLAAQGCHVLSIDIDAHRLAYQQARLPWLQQRLIRTGSLEFALQDARSLPYRDNVFQRITSISTIEHVPDDGDIAVARELARVLTPGGRLVYTMPYGKHFYPGRPPYSLPNTHRIYDDTALTERLVAPSGLREVARLFVVDRWFDFEYTVWRRIPYQLHNLTGWTGLGMVCAKVFFKAQPVCTGCNLAGAVLVLEKPA